MLIDSSSEQIPAADLVSKDQILSFLRDQNLIGDYKNHSAFEK